MWAQKENHSNHKYQGLQRKKGANRETRLAREEYEKGRIEGELWNKCVPS